MTEPNVIEILRTLSRALAAGQPACACHQVVKALCPAAPPAPAAEPTRGAVFTAQSVARLIDHTLLKPEATPDDVKRLCAEAKAHAFKAVCVNPIWVRLCASELASTDTAIAAVAGFPLGASVSKVKADEAARALGDGAREIDMVLSVGALRAGDHAAVHSDVRAVADACHAAGALLKVIIEAALLSDDQKVAACALSKLAGADFVKTSTGFGPGGATAADVALMRRTVGPGLGVKAAGGIRDWPSASAMIAAGANRIGTSSGVKILAELRQA